MLNLLSFSCFAAGIGIIEANKIKSGNPHFHSVHGILGVVTGVVLLVQYAFGFVMWGVPGLLGGVEKAKGWWKWHRLNGYLLYILVLVTVITATGTEYNQKVLDVKLWAVLVASGLLVVGVYPRIHTRKLGVEGGLGWFRGER